jgi:PKD repeat protein
MHASAYRRHPAGRWITFWIFVTIGLAIISLVPGAHGSVARAAGDIGYRGPSFAGAGSSPSGSKPESKLWWNDGYWWASLWDTATSDFYIYKLNLSTQTWERTNTPLDPRTGTRADVLWDGTKLYVASHVFTESPAATTSANAGKLWRFSYNASTDIYTLDSGFPVDINAAKTETLVIDKDSTGKLWATWTQGNRVYVNRTLSSDADWGTPFILPVDGTNVATDDISSVVAFDGNKIGVMWSNQNESTMNFAVHVDGQPDTTWSARSVAYGGSGNADDHINLKSLQSDGSRVFAAVKTSRSGSSDPLVVLLVYNRATNVWSSAVFGRVAEHHTRPIVLLDETNHIIHMFATSDENGGSIYEKTTPISDNPSFEPGRGTPFIEEGAAPGTSGDLNNATSTKQNVNCTTGLVVLATNSTSDDYWHNYQPLPGCGGPTPPTANFSATPTTGNAPLLVQFTDSSSGSPTSWAWDFDNNGTVDSTEQHPSYTYSSAGTYTVKLSVANANGSDDEIKTNYITVGAPPAAPTANFSATPTTGNAPLLVQFTDSSSGSPTSWAWDFDNNGTVDSTQPNPSYTYSSAGTYTVKLTVANAGGSDDEVKTNYITVSAGGGGSTFTFAPVADTYVAQASPTNTYGSAPDMRIAAGSTTTRQAFIRFTVSGLPAGATIASAKLRLVVVDASSSGGIVNSISDTTWAETITWNTKPAIDGPQRASVGAVAAGQVVEIDLTPAITGNGSYSFAITSAVSDSVWYATKENSTAANRPQLVITTQ